MFVKNSNGIFLTFLTSSKQDGLTLPEGVGSGVSAYLICGGKLAGAGAKLSSTGTDNQDWTSFGNLKWQIYQFSSKTPYWKKDNTRLFWYCISFELFHCKYYVLTDNVYRVIEYTVPLKSKADTISDIKFIYHLQHQSKKIQSLPKMYIYRHDTVVFYCLNLCLFIWCSTFFNPKPYSIYRWQQTDFYQFNWYLQWYWRMSRYTKTCSCSQVVPSKRMSKTADELLCQQDIDFKMLGICLCTKLQCYFIQRHPDNAWNNNVLSSIATPCFCVNFW